MTSAPLNVSAGFPMQTSVTPSLPPEQQQFIPFQLLPHDTESVFSYTSDWGLVHSQVTKKLMLQDCLYWRRECHFTLWMCSLCSVSQTFSAKAWKYNELLHVCFVFVVGLLLDIYFKPTFMRLRNIFAMFARALSFANVSHRDSVFKCLWYITVFSTLFTSCLQK